MHCCLSCLAYTIASSPDPVITTVSYFEASMLLSCRNDAKSKTGQQSTTDKISDTVGQKVRAMVVSIVYLGVFVDA